MVMSSVLEEFFLKNRISEFRKKVGLTQPELAKLCGLASYIVIQRYEKDQRTPPVDIAMRLARALNTTVEELFILDE